MKTSKTISSVLLLTLLVNVCQAEKPDYCNEDPDPGYGCNYEYEDKRYYFSPRAKYCIGFYYYGCGTNQNNFRSRESCEAICGLTQEEKCKLPLDTGRPRCRRTPSERYYFNEKAGSCQQFQFTSCGGNDNNFRTQEECEQKCTPSAFYGISPNSPCLTPLTYGRDRDSHHQYTFIASTGECERAFENGCPEDESGNIFDGFHKCMDTCNPNKVTSSERNHAAKSRLD